MKSRWIPHLPFGARLGFGAAALFALGATAGASVISLTRPAAQMAPTVPTPVSRLTDTGGVVTVRGRVAEVYGDRFTVQDATGKVLVDAGHSNGALVQAGSPIMVQGRFDDGQLRARYLVDAAGAIKEVGPPRHPAPPPLEGPGAAPPPPPGFPPLANESGPRRSGDRAPCGGSGTPPPPPAAPVPGSRG